MTGGRSEEELGGGGWKRNKPRWLVVRLQGDAKVKSEGLDRAMELGW